MVSSTNKHRNEDKDKISAEAFDELFEKGDVTPHLDFSTVKVHVPMQRINIDIPKPVLNRIDNEASRIGVTRTAIIKMWLSERLKNTNRA